MGPGTGKPHNTLSKDNLYGGIKILSRDGAILCRCNQKKADWYLSRKLAEKKADDAIMLTFETKGFGDEYSTIKKENICVVCGTGDKLTKHHIVPHSYRKHFPSRYKKNLCHDCVLLCVPCHIKYEEESHARQAVMFKKRGLPSTVDRGQLAALSAMRALRNHSDKIPQDRKEILWDTTAKFLGHKPELGELDEYLDKHKKVKTSSLRIVESMSEDELSEFIVGWRKHFMETMKPKFMPEGWSVDAKTRHSIREVKLRRRYMDQVRAFKQGAIDALKKAPKKGYTAPWIREAYETGYSLHSQ